MTSCICNAREIYLKVPEACSLTAFSGKQNLVGSPQSVSHYCVFGEPRPCGLSVSILICQLAHLLLVICSSQGVLLFNYSGQGYANREIGTLFWWCLVYVFHILCFWWTRTSWVVSQHINLPISVPFFVTWWSQGVLLFSYSWQGYANRGLVPYFDVVGGYSFICRSDDYRGVIISNRIY